MNCSSLSWRVNNESKGFENHPKISFIKWCKEYIQLHWFCWKGELFIYQTFWWQVEWLNWWKLIKLSGSLTYYELLYWFKNKIFWVKGDYYLMKISKNFKFYKIFIEYNRCRNKHWSSHSIKVLFQRYMLWISSLKYVINSLI